MAVSETHRSSALSDVPVGRRVFVIGGGNTAVDAAVQAKRLGAEEVTLVYRRGAEHMSATPVEREWAQTNGVTLRFWASPHHLLADQRIVRGICFARGAPGHGYDPQDSFTLEADIVLNAIGQVFVSDPFQNDQILVENGRIVVDWNCLTSIPGCYAGGYCTAGEDLTVAAVRYGRDAAEAIHAELMVSSAEKDAVNG